MPTGAIAFPGVVAPRHMIATRTLGARPDAAIIYALPQDGSPDTSGTSTLSFIFNGVPFYWTNCLCDRGTLQVSTSGHYQVFVILDRRWLWKKKWITQAYNLRNPDGSIIAATQRSLAGIVSDIFAVIGEVVDISAVSSTEYPELILDHDNCVDVIEELLNPRGYVISLHCDDTVHIYRRGVGAIIPFNLDVVTQNTSIDPPEVPQYLTALGSKTLIQSKLKMLPVGIDTDGSIKSVNSLSYKPSGGWDSTDLFKFNYVTSDAARELAIQTVGKWYQVASQADETFDLNFGYTNYNPGRFTVTSAGQYLPLSDSLLTTTTDINGRVINDRAFVEGKFWDDGRGTNTASFTRVDHRDWTLDGERGIIRFREPALKKTPGPVSGNFTFADVYLTCAYSVYNPYSYIKDRQYRSINLGGLGEDIEEVDELQRAISFSYAANSSTVDGVSDNLASFDSAADLYLNASQYKYTTQSGRTLLYRGLYPINTDGITLQVKWDVAVPGAASPFGTHVSQYSEGLVLLPTEHERQLVRRARLAADPMTQRKRRYQREKERL